MSIGDASFSGSGEDLRVLFDSFPDPTWIYDRQTLRFLEVNDAARAQYGYTPAEFRARTILDIRPPEDIERLRHQDAATHPEGFRQAGIWRHLCKDGRRIDVEICARSIDYGGRPCVLVIARNVTERQRALNALHESQELLATLLRNFPNGSVNVLDQELRFRFAAGQMLTRLGLTPATLVGKRLTELFPEETVAQLAPYYRQAFCGQAITFSLPAQDLVFEIHAAPLQGPDGEIDAIIVVAQDDTERKLAERALARSEERFRALTEHSSDIITVLAADGTVLYESPSITEVLGYRPEELIGRNGLALIHPEDLPLVVEALQEITQGIQRRDSIVYRFQHQDGSWRWLESTGTSQLDNPAIGGFVANSRDVTERLRLQKQVVQTEKLAALGELVAGVAHEINNPLAAISGYSQLLHLHPDSQVREDAAAIEEMVQRASRIVHSLRSYARPGEGERQPGDLNAVVASALHVVGYRLRTARVEIEQSLAECLPPVLMHPSEIEQVLVNLLTNAEHALRGRPEEARRVRIRTGLVAPRAPGEPGICRLMVEDTGCGMPPSVQARIFSPFYTTKDVGEGTGLGLYISHSIVVAHGGTIEVDSQVGRGARFIVSLPAGEAS